MKLLNLSLIYLSGALFLIVSTWAVLFYYNMLNEIKDNADQGLANYKTLIIYQLQDDSLIIENKNSIGANFLIREVEPAYALKIRDSYKDTLIFSSRINAFESKRLLTTAFGTEDEHFFEMKVISPVVDSDALIREIANSLLWLYIIIMIALLLVNNFVLKQIWKPFYQLIAQLKNYRLGEKAVFKPARTRVREFSDLNDAISRLLFRNLKIYKSQKQFIENAAHELQTPLAISISRLEVLIEKGDLSADDIQTAGNILHALEGLSKLDKSLLLLSKIENSQYPAEEELNFNGLIKGIISDVSEYAAYREVKIECTEKGIFTVQMNQTLAGILVVNLLKNAILHNHQGGEVTIEITAKSFTIENTGESRALDPGTMFERFHKTHGKKGSTGLGLAIVKAIADASGLNVEYSYGLRHSIKVSA